MKEKIVNNLKNNLINIKCNEEIGKVLYEQSIESGNFNIFIPALEDTLELFKDITHHLEIYFNSCKDAYKRHYGEDFSNNNIEHDDLISGHGSIKVVKDNNSLKIVLECE